VVWELWCRGEFCRVERVRVSIYFSIGDIPKIVAEKFEIPQPSVLLINEQGVIKSSSDAFTSESLYAINTELKEADVISKFYDESTYSKCSSIENVEVPVAIVGEEIKQLFNFPSQNETITVLKKIDKSYFDDYKWQLVILLYTLELIQRIQSEVIKVL